MLDVSRERVWRDTAAEEVAGPSSSCSRMEARQLAVHNAAARLTAGTEIGIYNPVYDEYDDAVLLGCSGDGVWRFRPTGESPFDNFPEETLDPSDEAFWIGNDYGGHVGFGGLPNGDDPNPYTAQATVEKADGEGVELIRSDTAEYGFLNVELERGERYHGLYIARVLQKTGRILGHFRTPELAAMCLARHEAARQRMVGRSWSRPLEVAACTATASSSTAAVSPTLTLGSALPLALATPPGQALRAPCIGPRQHLPRGTHIAIYYPIDDTWYGCKAMEHKGNGRWRVRWDAKGSPDEQLDLPKEAWRLFDPDGANDDAVGIALPTSASPFIWPTEMTLEQAGAEGLTLAQKSSNATGYHCVRKGRNGLSFDAAVSVSGAGSCWLGSFSTAELAALCATRFLRAREQVDDRINVTDAGSASSGDNAGHARELASLRPPPPSMQLSPVEWRAARKAMFECVDNAATEVGGVPRGIQVYWRHDRKWYEATVTAHNAADGLHTLQYAKDDVEVTLDLRQEIWVRSQFCEAEWQVVRARAEEAKSARVAAAILAGHDCDGSSDSGDLALGAPETSNRLGASEKASAGESEELFVAEALRWERERPEREACLRANPELGQAQRFPSVVEEHAEGMARLTGYVAQRGIDVERLRGWKCLRHYRGACGGASKNQHYTIFVAPCGKQLRSMMEVERFLNGGTRTTAFAPPLSSAEAQSTAPAPTQSEDVVLVVQEKSQGGDAHDAARADVDTTVELDASGEALRREEGTDDLDGSEEAEATLPGYVRLQILRALLAGCMGRDDVVAHVMEHSTVGEGTSCGQRATIVSDLGKEKKQKEPLWTQDHSQYTITSAGEALRGQLSEPRTGREHVVASGHKRGHGKASRPPSSSASAVPTAALPPVPSPVVEAILDANEAFTRFLVKWHGQPRERATWVPVRKLDAPLVDAFATMRQAEFNRGIEPLLMREEAHSGVVSLSVPQADAAAVAAHLQQQWVDGELHVGHGKVCTGYSSYGKVLGQHDGKQQSQDTLLITNALLPFVRLAVAGFHAVEEFLVGWLEEQYGTVVELFYAHGLRQGPETLASTGFAVHQDTEDYDFIEYTVVVKLTADGPGEPPSEMRVVGAPIHFQYGAHAGASGCFRARAHHSSVAPQPGSGECLKVAFFFRKSVQGERRAKRTLAACGAGQLSVEELAHVRRRVTHDLNSFGFEAQALSPGLPS